MIGTLVNVAAIIIGTLLGLVLRKGFPEKMKGTITMGMGLCVVLIGMKGALETGNVLLVIVAVVLGSAMGSALKIEERLDKAGLSLQKKFAAKDGNDNFAKGFVTATLIYCVGAMAIVGSIDSGLRGNHNTLFAKSLLDGVLSVALASTMGIGVIMSAVAVLIYQGGIALLAQLVEPLLTDAMITEMGAVGGVLIMGVGLNLIRKEHIPVGDMVPAIFLPLVLTLFM